MHEKEIWKDIPGYEGLYQVNQWGKSVNGRPVLYSLDEMTTDFPHALAYLNSFKNKLDERNMPGRTTENWFAFGRSQSLRRFLAGEHLV